MDCSHPWAVTLAAAGTVEGAPLEAVVAWAVGVAAVATVGVRGVAVLGAAWIVGTWVAGLASHAVRVDSAMASANKMMVGLGCILSFFLLG